MKIYTLFIVEQVGISCNLIFIWVLYIHTFSASQSLQITLCDKNVTTNVSRRGPNSINNVSLNTYILQKVKLDPRSIANACVTEIQSKWNVNKYSASTIYITMQTFLIAISVSIIIVADFHISIFAQKDKQSLFDMEVIFCSFWESARVTFTFYNKNIFKC